MTAKEMADKLTIERTRGGDRHGAGLVGAIRDALELRRDRDLLEIKIRTFNGTEKERSALAAEVEAMCTRAHAGEEAYKTYLKPCIDEALQGCEDTSTLKNWPRRDPHEDTLFNVNESAAAAPQSRKRKHDADIENVQGSMLDRLHETTVTVPSDYHSAVRNHKAMATPTQIERQLREGYATEALDELRLHLTTHATIAQRRKNGSGIIHKTAVDRRLRTKKEAINGAKHRYREHRALLRLLGMSEDDRTFRPLGDEDCKALIVVTEEERLGDSRRRPSWIWGTLSFVDMVKDGDLQAFLRESTSSRIP